MKLLQIKLEDEKLSQLKHLAVDENTNVSNLVRDAIDTYILSLLEKQ